MKFIGSLVKCFKGHASIKVMTVDGVCRRYEAPMNVKVVLVDFPDHAIFHSETVHKLGSRSRPLPGSTAMEPGHLYFLVPLPLLASNHRAGTEDTSDKPAMPPSTKRQGSGGGRRVTFADSPFYIDSEPVPSMQITPLRKPSLNVLPTLEDGAIRLKLVVSKQQMEAIINGGGDALQDIILPLLKSKLHSGVSTVNYSGWEPTLDFIPETLSRPV